MRPHNNNRTEVGKPQVLLLQLAQSETSIGAGPTRRFSANKSLVTPRTIELYRYEGDDALNVLRLGDVEVPPLHPHCSCFARPENVPICKLTLLFFRRQASLVVARILLLLVGRYFYCGPVSLRALPAESAHLCRRLYPTSRHSLS